MHSYGVSALLLVGGSCGRNALPSEPVTPYVTLLTAESTVSLGTSVTVQITNLTGFVLQFGACDMKLEVLTRDGWRSVAKANARNCTDELLGVAARSTRAIPLQIPPDIEAGAHRVLFSRFIVQGQDTPNDGLVPSEQLSTNLFAVR
jgi:hypothetical protein